MQIFCKKVFLFAYENCLMCQSSNFTQSKELVVQRGKRVATGEPQQILEELEWSVISSMNDI